MTREKLNTVLLTICTILLIACSYKVYLPNDSPECPKCQECPTLEEIDQRIMHWGQHFGAVYSD